MKRLSKKDLGRFVVVEAWDHSETGGDDAGAVLIQVIGKLVRYDRRVMVIRSWDAPYEHDVGNARHDQAILRSAIQEVAWLAKEK